MLFFLLLWVMLWNRRIGSDGTVGFTVCSMLELAVELGIFAVWLNG